MEIILLDKLANLGSLGDKVSVKAGYARNYLIPQGKAVMATKDNIAKFEERRAELEAKAADVLTRAQGRLSLLSAMDTIVLSAKAGDEGKLFGSIGTRDIADAVTAKGLELSKSEVRLPEGALRHTGEFAVTVQLHSEVKGEIKLEIVAGE